MSDYLHTVSKYACGCKSNCSFKGLTNQLHCVFAWCWWNSSLQDHENFKGLEAFEGYVPNARNEGNDIY